VESNVARLSSVIATARALPHGKVIETEDLQIVWIPVDTLQRNHIRSVDEVVGLQTTRQIAPLQHIRRTDLTQALLVKKGDAVTLRISRGAMTIEMDAIAAESGAFGDQITVVNPNSGKRIRATVVSKNLVAGI
jgi:flagella basal body P-ring formation protein FlgA